jgi:hypothetical protein
LQEVNRQEKLTGKTPTTPPAPATPPAAAGCALRSHRFEAEAIRVHVTATQGDEAARIFEIRCYA